MNSMRLPHAALPPDTQAVLLLCGTFAGGRGSLVKPLTPGEYNALASWLAHQGKRPAALLQHPEELLCQEEPGLPSVDRLRALLDRGVQMSIAVEGWHRLGLWIVSRAEDRYPERLRHLRSAAPPLLYGAGDISLLDRGGLAIVGSRNPSEEVLFFTRQVAERCAAQDVQIISGGARGVDQASVAAALEAGGAAVAVLADRLDRAATSRDAKEPLRSGRLALVTPYEPESSFAVGRAMGRNKHIYALADYALVAHFKTGEGGTWAGAIEQLGRNKSASVCVPVFVRVANNPADGWNELQSKGALPFPEDNFWSGNSVEILRQAASMPETPSEAANQPATSTESSSPPTAEPDTCYHRCLPLLLQHFQQEIRTNQLPEIARELQLQRSQLEDWLRRAIAEGKLTKKKKKGRVVYVDAAAGAEQTLFDRDGDAA